MGLHIFEEVASQILKVEFSTTSFTAMTTTRRAARRRITPLQRVSVSVGFGSQWR